MLTIVPTVENHKYGRVHSAGANFAPAVKLPTPISAASRDPADSVQQLGELACVDVPVAVGYMIVTAYISILLAFGVVFSGASDVSFVIAVCGFYLAVYIGVPVLFFKLERSRRIVGNRLWVEFLETGLSTSTGQVSGVSALAQIFTIPVALTVAVCGIGLMLMLAQT